MTERPLRTMARVVFVMILVGLWHGAGYNFLLFGLCAGLEAAGFQGLRYLSGGRPLLGSSRASGVVAAGLHLLFLLPLFFLFRIPDLATGRALVGAALAHTSGWRHVHDPAVLLVGVAAVAHLVRGLWPAARLPLRLPPLARALFWFALILGITFGAYGEHAPFIYFRF